MAGVYHYILHKFRMTPSQFESLPYYDKVFIIGSIIAYVKQEKQEIAKAERR